MEATHNFVVYRHIAPNGKMYIGITKQKPKYRWGRGSGYRTNEYFMRAIRKYGWNNFAHEILQEGLSEEEAWAVEKELIAEYHTNDSRFGYNHSNGGDNTFAGTHTDQHEGKSARARRISQFTKDGQFVREWSASTEIERVLGIGYTNIIKCCTEATKFSKGFVWIYSEDVTPEKVAERCEKARYRYNEPMSQEHRRNISEGIKKHYRDIRGEDHETSRQSIRRFEMGRNDLHPGGDHGIRWVRRRLGLALCRRNCENVSNRMHPSGRTAGDQHGPVQQGQARVTGNRQGATRSLSLHRGDK